MAEHNPFNQQQIDQQQMQQPAPTRQDWGSEEVYDGIELSDEDLEYVVGGLSPEASLGMFQSLQSHFGIDPFNK